MGCSSSSSTLESKRLEMQKPHHLLENIAVDAGDRNIHNFYHISPNKVLGSGISGPILLCTHRTTKVQYALKTHSLHNISAANLRQYREEVAIMKELDHPNIVRLYETFECSEKMFLIMELCTGGELFDRLHKQDGRKYDERSACTFIHTITSAIRYCHSRRIVHRDLKLENFLFENEKPDALLKMIDFGLSKHMGAERQATFEGAVGSSYYVAPEVLKGKYDEKCDIWSIGVMTYMLLSGIPPFNGKTDKDILTAVAAGKWAFNTNFGVISKDAKNFITACLTVKSKDRPGCEELLRHEWFKILTGRQQDRMISLDVVNKLQAFGRRSNLAKFCMEVIVHTMEPSQIEGLRKEFMSLDTQGKGEITLRDLRSILKRSLCESDIEKVFDGIDYDHSGTINYHEFLAATVSRRLVTEANLKAAFEKLSHHADAFKKDDVQEMLGEDCDDGCVESIFRDAHLDADRQIHFRTFKNLLAIEPPSPRPTGKLELFPVSPEKPKPLQKVDSESSLSDVVMGVSDIF